MKKVIKYCLIVAILLVTACSLTPSGDLGEDLKGQGTEGNPYQLFSVEDLFKIVEVINSGNEAARSAHYILKNDIDLEDEEWLPIGYYHPNFEVQNNAFYGVFDGNNHRISNLNILMQEGGLKEKDGKLKTLGLGMFALLGEGALVKDLKLEGVNILRESLKNPYYVAVGCLAGVNDGGYIENCYVEGKMTIEENVEHLGGIVGLNYGFIVNSFAKYYIEGVYNAKKTEKTKSGAAYVGGICGTNIGTIEESTCEGTVKMSGEERYQNLGGFVGNNLGGTVKDCLSKGTVESTIGSAMTGGMVGYNSGLIDTCRNNTKILATGESWVGGFVGYNAPSDDGKDIPLISNSYSLCNIQAKDTVNLVLGNFAGENSGIIQNSICYLLNPSNISLVGIGSEEGIISKDHIDPKAKLFEYPQNQLLLT